MPLVMWTPYFLLGQGVKVSDNIIYQDNMSAMLLEKNGMASSSRRTRHVNLRYYFITDRISSRECTVEYCATANMIGDFFTKPLQGTKFLEFRAIIMNERS